jgi:hypothetical protein
MTRRYVPTSPASAKRLTQLLSPMRRWKVAHGVQADFPPLADDRPGGLDPGNAQVLAEDARGKFTLELAHPVVGIPLRVGIEGLVLAAVVDPAGLDVAVQPEFVHLHGPFHGTFVDGGDTHAPRVGKELVYTADGKQSGGVHGISLDTVPPMLREHGP